VRVDVTRIRNRIGKFLFRRELYPLKHAETWGVLHRRWLRQLRFEDRASELDFQDTIQAHDILVARREQLERHWPRSPRARSGPPRSFDSDACEESTPFPHSAWWLKSATSAALFTRGF
jgi:hypothetical protein